MIECKRLCCSYASSHIQGLYKTYRPVNINCSSSKQYLVACSYRKYTDRFSCGLFDRIRYKIRCNIVERNYLGYHLLSYTRTSPSLPDNVLRSCPFLHGHDLAVITHLMDSQTIHFKDREHYLSCLVNGDRMR